MENTAKINREKKSNFFTRFAKNRLAVLGLIILIILGICALFPDFIAPFDYAAQDLTNRFVKPNSTYLFGTDDFGRDVFSRVVHGARISILIGFGSTAIALLIGVLFGSFAGYFGGTYDNVMMRIMDIILSIPSLVLAIAISAALGNGMKNLMFAVSIAAVPGYARVVRSSVIGEKNKEYVEAARLSGSSDIKIIISEILPNCIGPIIVQATLGVGTAILSAASLSFIGMGIQPPAPEWGSMLSAGRAYIRDYPHITLFPGLAIAITIFSLNVVGDGLRDAFDPKQRS